MHLEDAFDFLVERLAALLATGGGGAIARSGTYGGDIWIPMVVAAYWQPRIARFNVGELQDEHFQPFYDAAWELCRIGVLRPGSFAPRGQAMGGQLFSGDGFSLTQFGREWLKNPTQRPIRDPSRLAGVLQSFARRFGDGYAQRATEAASTYRNANYLAACVMAGAAAESILLAVAIAKTGNEARSPCGVQDEQWAPQGNEADHGERFRGHRRPVRNRLASVALLARRCWTRHHDRDQ